MEESGKKSSVTSSSLVDLKAELFRKQEDVRWQKLGKSHITRTKQVDKPSGKKNVWNAKNTGVSERAERDLEDKAEDEDVLEKSRKRLAEKAKLYENMANSRDIPEDDGSEGFLVDFQKKAIDSIVEERERQRREEEEEAERQALSEDIPPPSGPDEEWVDYTDSLGRDRKCLRKDLKEVMRRDHDLTRKSNDGGVAEEDNDAIIGPSLDLMSTDMHKEHMRQKWEQEAQDLLDKGQDDIHYSNVQHDEIRSHGVGFFQFSKDHEERSEQMTQLNKLREQTKTAQTRGEQVKAKRKAMMEARLAKVRERRKLKGGPDPKEEQKKEEENEEKAEREAEQRRKEEEGKKKQEEDAVETRKNHVREWDKAKKETPWMGMAYVESRREEREEEFAPPSAYFQETKPRVRGKAPPSDFDRLDRLRKTTSGKGRDPQFAPPSCYRQEGQAYTSKNEDVDHKRPQNLLSSTNKKKTSHEVSCKQPAYTEQATASSSSSSSSSHIANLDNIPLPTDSKQAAHHQDMQLQPQPTPSTPDHWQTATPVPPVSNNQQLSSNTTNHYPGYYPQQTMQSQYDYHSAQMQQSQSYHYPGQTTENQTGLSNLQAQQYYHYCQNYQNMHTAQGNYTDPSQTCPDETSNAVYSNTNAGGANTQAETIKRPLEDTAAESSVKKTKVPKSFIMDTRFMLNSESSESETVADISSQPYQPGSFTAAKLAQQESYEEVVDELSKKTQIAGGPMIYSKEELQEQQEKFDEEADEEKIKEFLSSV